MNLLEIAQNLKYQRDGEERLQEVYEELIGSHAYLKWQDPYKNPYRIMFHWVGSWNCTDTEVGYRMYCFDDIPVGFSVQTARKSSEEFYWFKDAPIKAMREYLHSLEEEDHPTLNFIDPEDTEIGEGFHINYNADAKLNHLSDVYFGNVPATILEYIVDEGDKPYSRMLSSQVKIQYGEIVEVVDISELTFSWYLEEKGGTSNVI